MRLFFLKIDPSVDISVENWATITVNSEVITWESSNDLCTFYRNQPILKSYEDLTTYPVSCTEATAVSSQPPATIDIIPPTPTTAVSEPPSFCTRCSCDLQKEANQQNEEESDSLETKLANKLTDLQSQTKQNANITENISSKILSGNSFTGKAPVVSSASSVKSSVVASTSTTQLHRSQVCSTEITSSSCAGINKQQQSNNSYSQLEHQNTTRGSRPSTPHKPLSSKQTWKEQASSHKDNQSDSGSSNLTYNKQNKNNSTDLKKESNIPLTTIASINSNVVNVTKGIPLSTNQDKNGYQNVQSNFGPYPLKKHPLINVKAGNLLKIAASSAVASKSKVFRNFIIQLTIEVKCISY